VSRQYPGRVDAAGFARLLSLIPARSGRRAELALGNLAGYYQGARTRLALRKDAPVPPTVQLPEKGRVIEIPEVGRLHHLTGLIAAVVALGFPLGG
jgi:hypothetical protein